MSTDPTRPVTSKPHSRPALLRIYPAAWRERYGDEMAELIDGQRLSLRDSLDLLRGALDAHCNLGEMMGGWSAKTSQLRSAAVTTFTAWVMFCVSFGGLVKCTEDPSFGQAARGDAALGVSYALMQAAFVLAGLVVLIGGLPLALVALRQAWRSQDSALARLLGVPVIAALTMAAYVLLALRMANPAGVHSGVNVALFAGLLVLGGSGTVATVVAVRATIYRVELPVGLLRWAGWLALVAAGAISVGVAALVAYGWVLRTEEPVLFSSASGLLATRFPANYLVILALGLLAAVSAGRAATGGLRQLRVWY